MNKLLEHQLPQFMAEETDSRKGFYCTRSPNKFQNQDWKPDLSDIKDSTFHCAALIPNSLSQKYALKCAY